jgi:putative membrane protein
MNRRRWLPVLGLAVVVLLVISGLRTTDRATWLMEVAPIVVAAPVLLATRRSFPLTSLLYVMIFVHAVILIVGGTYTYARVPFGFWLRDTFGFDRNPYDRIGHFAQGFVPALIARELFLRLRIVRTPAWSATLAVSVALAISAVYELVEWGAAVALGQGADAFLGTQGDEWDTQSDMAMAFIGALVAVLFFARYHDRQIADIDNSGRTSA